MEAFKKGDIVRKNSTGELFEVVDIAGLGDGKSIFWAKDKDENSHLCVNLDGWFTLIND